MYDNADARFVKVTLGLFTVATAIVLVLMYLRIGRKIESINWMAIWTPYAVAIAQSVINSAIWKLKAEKEKDSKEAQNAE